VYSDLPLPFRYSVGSSVWTVNTSLLLTFTGPERKLSPSEKPVVFSAKRSWARR